MSLYFLFYFKVQIKSRKSPKNKCKNVTWSETDFLLDDFWCAASVDLNASPDAGTRVAALRPCGPVQVGAFFAARSLVLHYLVGAGVHFGPQHHSAEAGLRAGTISAPVYDIGCNIATILKICWQVFYCFFNCIALELFFTLKVLVLTRLIFPGSNYIIV